MNEIIKYMITPAIVFGVLLFLLTGCAQAPKTVAFDTLIPDELTDAVVADSVPPAAAIPKGMEVPESCNESIDMIVQHFDVSQQQVIQVSEALAICNDNLKTLHRIHEETQVAPPGS